MTCQEKIAYSNRPDANAALENTAAKAKAHGDRSWKRLTMYRCGQCFKYHVGHLRTLREPKPEQAPKPPSAGELRRKLKRMAEDWERHDDRLRKRRAAELAKLIDADRTWLAAVAEQEHIARERSADFAESLRMARTMVEQLFR